MSTQHRSDAELLSLLQSPGGMSRGMRLLMATYQERLYWLIRRMVVDAEVAQDVLQDTFVKAYQNLDKFRGESGLYTWLYRIAVNESLRQLDRMKRQARDEQAFADCQVREVQSQADPQAAEIEVLLQQALQTLPDKQRAVFSLRYFDDLPHEEIARILGMSEGSSKTNYHHARTRVEDYLRKHAPEF